MKPFIPVNLLIATLCVVLLFLQQAYVFLACLCCGLRVPVITAFYIAWSLTFFVFGIWRKQRIVLRISSVIFFISGTSAAIVFAGSLLLYSSNPRLFLPTALWGLFCAIYMYAIVYLLSRPSANSYFVKKNKRSRNRDAASIGEMDKD
jgi:hypothetical protein